MEIGTNFPGLLEVIFPLVFGMNNVSGKAINRLLTNSKTTESVIKKTACIESLACVASIRLQLFLEPKKYSREAPVDPDPVRKPDSGLRAHRRIVLA